MNYELVNSPSFTAKVGKWVLQALRPDLTFEQLLLDLPCVYPTTVSQVLRELVIHGRLSAEHQVHRRAGHLRVGRPPTAEHLLPLPHPVNFEWRFSFTSADHLLRLALNAADNSRPVLLFGTPGVAAEALTANLTKKVIFVGEDNVVTHRIASLNRTMNSPLSVHSISRLGVLPRASVVVVDPPWYLDLALPMLAAAAASLVPGGWLFVSLPPEGVRPTAREDRVAVLDYVHELGMALEGQYPRSLTYQTPFFEQNALAAAGLAVRSNWRTGDLAVFRKAHEGAADSLIPRSSMSTWTEVDIGSTRVFVRNEGSEAGDAPGLVPIVGGNVLPTVRRRDPRRQLASVITSGNRVFAGPSSSLVIEAAVLASRTLNGSGSPLPTWCTIAEQAAIERVAAELREIAALESAELRATTQYQGYHGGLACTLRSMMSSNDLQVATFG